MVDLIASRLELAGMRTVKLRSGEAIPALGQGAWHMAENPRRRADEIAASRVGLDLGMCLIDTAEMYAHGRSEQLVGEAIAGRRDEVFLVSKVLPSNATRHRMPAACARSLERLGTDRLDLYLLHWRGRARLEEAFEAFEALVRQGSIRHWGVSNFDRSDMVEAASLPAAGDLETDQVLYNLARSRCHRLVLAASGKLTTSSHRASPNPRHAPNAGRAGPARP